MKKKVRTCGKESESVMTRYGKCLGKQMCAIQRVWKEKRVCKKEKNVDSHSKQSISVMARRPVITV